MESKLTTLDGDEVKLSVIIDAAEFDKEVGAALKRMSKNIRLPGFRPGKIPRKVLEARLGPSAGRQDALEHSLPNFYGQAVVENEVDFIGPPKIEITGGLEKGDITFDAVVPIRPRPSISGHDAIKIEVPSPEISEEELQTQLDNMRKQLSTLEPADRPAAVDDLVSIDIDGTLNGEPVPGLSASDYLYEVGSAAVVPELDEYLCGASSGDHLEFEATHPNEDDPLFLVVEVGQVQARILPDVDDEFAKQVSDFSTSDELRSDLKDRMGQSKRQQIGSLARDLIAKAVGELIEIDIPDDLIESEIERRISDLEMRIRSQGLELEKYLEITGGEIETLRDEFRPMAEVAARIDLGLRAVAYVEYLDEDEESFEKYLLLMGQQMGMGTEELRLALKNSGRALDVRADVSKDAALNWLMERSEILDEDGNSVDPTILEPIEPDIPDLSSKVGENIDEDDESDLTEDGLVTEDNNDQKNDQGE